LCLHVLKKLIFVEVRNVVVRLEEWRIELVVYRKLGQPVVTDLFEPDSLKSVPLKFWIAKHIFRVEGFRKEVKL
jgi:hypothetical protein